MLSGADHAAIGAIISSACCVMKDATFRDGTGSCGQVYVINILCQMPHWIRQNDARPHHLLTRILWVNEVLSQKMQCV